MSEKTYIAGADELTDEQLEGVTGGTDLTPYEAVSIGLRKGWDEGVIEEQEATILADGAKRMSGSTSPLL